MKIIDSNGKPDARMSIVIPFFNQMHHICGQWQVLSKNMRCHDDVEIIAWDNGSTDGSHEYVRDNVLQLFKHSRLVQSTKNLGICKPINKAFSMCSGEFFGIIHDDIFMFEIGWDSRVFRRLETDPFVHLVGGFGAMEIHPNGIWKRSFSNFVDAERHGSRSASSGAAAHVDGSTMFMRRKSLEIAGGFAEDYDYDYSYDKEICLRFHSSGLLCGWEGFLHWHCNNGGNTAGKHYCRSGIPGGLSWEEGCARALEQWRIKWSHLLPLIL